MNQHKIEEVKPVVGGKKRYRKEHDHKTDCPENNHAALKKLNILIILTLHIHRPHLIEIARLKIIESYKKPPMWLTASPVYTRTIRHLL
jgi:hypothetical protein